MAKSRHIGQTPRPDSTVAPANRGGMRNGMTQAWAASWSQMGDAEKTSSQQSAGSPKEVSVGSSVMEPHHIRKTLNIMKNLKTIQIPRIAARMIKVDPRMFLFGWHPQRGSLLLSIWSQVTEVPQVHGIRISMAMILSQHESTSMWHDVTQVCQWLSCLHPRLKRVHIVLLFIQFVTFLNKTKWDEARVWTCASCAADVRMIMKLKNQQHPAQQHPLRSYLEINHWIGIRENLDRNRWFVPMKYECFLTLTLPLNQPTNKLQEIGELGVVYLSINTPAAP